MGIRGADGAPSGHAVDDDADGRLDRGRRIRRRRGDPGRDARGRRPLVAYLAFRTPFLAVLTYALRPGGDPAGRPLRSCSLMALAARVPGRRDRPARPHGRCGPRHRPIAARLVAAAARRHRGRRATSTSTTAARRRRSSSGPFGLAVIREVADATAEDVELADPGRRPRPPLARPPRSGLRRPGLRRGRRRRSTSRPDAGLRAGHRGAAAVLAGSLPRQRSLSEARLDRLARHAARAPTAAW